MGPFLAVHGMGRRARAPILAQLCSLQRRLDRGHAEHPAKPAGRPGLHDGRDESARVKTRLPAIGAVEPDAKLACELQGSQRLSVRSPYLVDGIVSHVLERVKKIRNFLRKDALERQAAKHVVECLAFITIGGMMGSDQLRHEFGELAQLDDSRRGVVTEIPLREPPNVTNRASCTPRKPKVVDPIPPPYVTPRSLSQE